GGGFIGYGGGGSGGAVYNSGALNISDCSLEGNSASGGGGWLPGPAQGNAGAAVGGAVCNTGRMAIERSLFANNTAYGTGGGPGVNGGWDYGYGVWVGGPPEAIGGGSGGFA